MAGFGPAFFRSRNGLIVSPVVPEMPKFESGRRDLLI